MTVKELKDALANFDDNETVFMNIGTCFVEVQNVSKEEDIGVLIDYGLDE